MKVLLAAGWLVAIVVTGTAHGEEAATPPTKINPHRGEGNCQVCHVASENDLTSWFTFTSTKKMLRKDFNELCRQCHGIQFGHGVGKAPSMNKRDLPLDADGKIACAITCHNMHVKDGDPVQQKYHLRFTQYELCVSCHKQ